MAFFLGLDIGGTNIRAALVAANGSVEASNTAGWSGGDPEEAVAVAADLAGTLSEGGALRPVGACGAGCAGLVDRSAGVVRSSPNLPTWHDVELTVMLKTALGLPTLVDNDANAAMYAESLMGAAKGAENAVMLTLGTGVGGGLVLGGVMYRGSHGFAGEIGHMTVDVGGESCPCGHEGCLEALVNGRSIVARAQALMDQGAPGTLSAIASEGTMTSRDVGEAARGGDPVAVEAVEAAGASLGVGLANIVSILDPEVIVVGGGVSAIGEPLLGAARREMLSRLAARGGRVPALRIAELGELAGVVGAALLARDELEPR